MTKIQIEGDPDFRLIKEGETVTEVIHGGTLCLLLFLMLGQHPRNVLK
jgi:hypothetical protein